MRLLAATAILFGAGLLFLTGANQAQEKKDVILKGTVTCAKCDLAVEKKCATVIVVKDAKEKKDVVYYFDTAAHKKNHGDICSTPKAGTVEGTVKDDGKKKVVTVKKVSYD